MPIEVTPDQVHSIEVDPSQVSSAAAPASLIDRAIGGVKSFASGLGEQINPLTIAKGARDAAYGAMVHPIDTVKGIAQAQTVPLQHALDAYHRGDYVEAARHALGYALPIIGPQMDQMGDDAQAGNVAHALGSATGFGLVNALPGSEAANSALSKVQSVKLPAVLPKAATALDSAAADFATSRGIPISAATRTGNKFVSGVQALADHSPIGAVIAQKSAAAEKAGFHRVGQELASQAHPDAVVPEQAGDAVTAGIEKQIAARHAEANQHYDVIRELEADPANLQQVRTKKDGPLEDVALPADVREGKKQLRPIYNQIMRQLPVTQQRASAGLKAIENILNGPDYVPASQLETDLGTIKGIARGADLPELRNMSQGLGAFAVKNLDGAVQDALKNAKRSIPGGSNAATGETTARPAAASTAPQVPSGSGETTVSFGGEKHPAKYSIDELGDLNGSHSGLTFQPNPKYGNVTGITNERDYENPLNQRKILDWSSPAQFDERKLISNTGDATSGPPLRDANKDVLSGNGRKMILDRVYAQHPELAARYRGLLESEAPLYGKTAEQVRAMKQPVLNRVIDESAFQAPGARQAAITDTNVTDTAALTPSERAISDARRVSPDTLDAIAAKLAEHGPDSTLAQVTEGQHGHDIMQMLMRDKVVSPQQGAELMTKDGLTPAGKTRISQLMLGRMFENADHLDNIAPAMRNKIERIAAPITKTEGPGGFDLTTPTKQAIHLLDDYRRSGAATLGDFDAQHGIFGNQKYSPQAKTLAESIQNANPTALAKSVQGYAEHAKYAREYQGPGLFGEFPDPHTPTSAFNDVFGTNHPDAPPEIGQTPTPSVKTITNTPAPPPRAPVPGTPAGDEAIAALRNGRAATAAKYDAASVLKALPKSGEEGVQVFKRAIWDKDAGIGQLRRVAELSPEAMPKLGRAYLDDVLGTQSVEGLNKGQGMMSKWDRLGPETKKLLFKNPMLVGDLDKFFLAAKRAGEHPNPSGSALVGTISAGTGYALTHPLTGVPLVIGAGALSALMHSPRALDALTRGLTVSVADRAAAAAAAARILKIAGDAAKPAVSPYPAAAANQSPQSVPPELLATR